MSDLRRRPIGFPRPFAGFKRAWPLFLVLWIFATTLVAHADAIILNPAADTMLIEEAPSNNAGGMIFFNSGTTQNYTRNRGLFRFDPAPALPTGSTVTNVAVTMEVVGRSKDGFTPATFELHRVLRPWGEGTQTPADPNHPGLGAPAAQDEATWTAAFALTTNLWSSPGGQPGSDFARIASSQTTVYGVEDSPYTFPSTPELVADVQSWLARPEQNYGWILIGQDESVNFTARRFASREDTANAPKLQVGFTPPPRIQTAGFDNGSFILQFTAQSGQAYTVEYRGAVTDMSPWLELTNLPPVTATTNIVVTDPLSSTTRFYRLRLP